MTKIGATYPTRPPPRATALDGPGTEDRGPVVLPRDLLQGARVVVRLQQPQALFQRQGRRLLAAQQGAAAGGGELAHSGVLVFPGQGLQQIQVSDPLAGTAAHRRIGVAAGDLGEGGLLRFAQ